MALWAQWGLPGLSGPAEGAYLPLSKHRGMMCSFDLGTGGLGQIPGLTRCVCACMCVCVCVFACACVRGYSRDKREPVQGVFGVLVNGHRWQTKPHLAARHWGVLAFLP